MTQHRLRKRLRQTTQSSNGSDDIVDEVLISEVSATSDLYPVKGILAESSDEFLIDWEVDLITGQSYSPSWVRLLSFSPTSLNM